MIAYNPINWYWIIGGSQIYSSSSGGVVDPTDSSYNGWRNSGRAATPIATSVLLDAELQRIGLPPTGLSTPSPAILKSHANAKVVSLLSAARIYSGSAVSGITMPEGVTVILCAEIPSAPDLLAINAWGNANSTSTQRWTDDAYNVFTMTGAQAVTFSNAALAYGQSVYDMLATAVIDIGNGSITTMAQIDALSWPE